MIRLDDLSGLVWVFLFSKVSADGSDKQNANKNYTSKFKNAAFVHNIVQIFFFYRTSTHTCFLGNCSCFLSSADFSSIFFFEIILSNIILCIPMPNSLYPDQARIFVKPDLGPNCYPRLLAEDAGR